MAEPYPHPPDLATVAARFAAALRSEGLPVGPEAAARFAAAVTAVRPLTNRTLRWCAQTTLVNDPADLPAFERVFTTVFSGLVDPASDRSGRRPPDLTDPATPRTPGSPGASRPIPPSAAGPPGEHRPAAGGTPEMHYRMIAADTDRLGSRDFAELSAAELAQIAALMRRFALRTPTRPSRRPRRAGRGTVDLRTTLRQARRTGGHPVRLTRRRPTRRQRKLVVLCDISGSMEPYARALLQLVYGAAGGASAEVFTFATRLTRLTRALRRTRPDAALEAAGRLAPDWAGGTRIGAALKEFNDRYGCRGLARGAVVLVISDGWETGDPAVLGREMGRLARVAHRVVWANPRTQSPRFRPLTGGMAAVWQYCDRVVSAHRLAALDELTDAVADVPRGRRVT